MKKMTKKMIETLAQPFKLGYFTLHAGLFLSTDGDMESVYQKQRQKCKFNR